MSALAKTGVCVPLTDIPSSRTSKSFIVRGVLGRKAAKPRGARLRHNDSEFDYEGFPKLAATG
jgi:hypothetical protein